MKRLFLVLLLVGVCGFAQAQTATLSGKITDQTGAVISGASVTVTAADGKQTSATTDGLGAFQVQSLAPGSYTVAAGAEGFKTSTKPGVVLTAGHTQTLTLTLDVKVEEQKVEVQGDEGKPELDVNSSSNASALILKGKDLEALSDDPDELQSELQALAGPSAGPNGGQIYIDGFTGGQLPPKSSIREIRINQNPFSAQYDKLGYGRIEIFTKPGSDKLHGQFFVNDSNAVLNSRNPYVFTPKPSYNTDIFDGNLGGPMGRKASFFLDASRRNYDEFAAIHATDPDLGPGTFTDSVPNPRTRTNFSPRFDFQLSQNNTLTARYQLTHDTDQNSGLGQFSLPSLAYNQNETEHTVQISDTQILNPKVVNETRFQFQREKSHTLPLSGLTQVQVQGAFTAGGSSQGDERNTENNYELQNYTSVTHGNHLIKFGAKLRGLTISNSSTANFNGIAVFSPVTPTSGPPVDALTVYQNFKQNGCSQSGSTSCPSQLSISAGQPQVELNMFDAGLYAEDEWRVRPNLSFTYGLRFESQNDIHDHADFAPRLGVAWGLGSDGKAAPKTVLRAGFGIFYDRFGWNLLEQADRLNGQPGSMQSLTLPNPSFFPSNEQITFADLQGAGVTSAPTIYQIDRNLRAPYTMQTAASIERQITKAATVSVTYMNSRGLHQLYIRNINAPYNPNGPGALSGTYNNDNVYQYDSEGVFRQNQLIANARVTLGRRGMLFGFYMLGYADSNVAAGGGGGFFGSGTTSVASFLSNQFDPMADYGRAAFDVRSRAFIGGSIDATHGFRLSPFIIINSGQPYNITTGQDNNGDSRFNDRPWLASNSPIVCTSLASFSPQSTAFGKVPVNTCTGPGNATVNLRLSKTFGFGRESKGGGGFEGGGRGGPRGGGLGGRGLSGGGGNPFSFGSSTNRRYNLTFSISARNLLNSANPGPPVGIMNSPFFGQSISIAGGPFSSASANRRVDLQAMFSF